jgi:hypothetical protein
MSAGVRQSNFDPPTAASSIEKRGKNRLVAKRETAPRNGGPPQQNACELSSRSRLRFPREEM